MKNTKIIILIAAIIYTAIFILAGFGCANLLDKREMKRSARAVLETPDLTKGLPPSDWEPLPPVDLK
jgi:hypothetical protein